MSGSFGPLDIKALIDAGAGYGAEVIGSPFQWFRPTAATAPLDPANQMGTVSAYIDPDFQFSGRKPNLYGHPLWGAFYDRSVTAVGDYLVGDAGKFFIVAQQIMLPTAWVACNGTISASRPAGTDLAHEDTYGGETVATNVALMTGWPASILHAGRTIASRADLPGDAAMGGFEVLMPAWPGVTLRTSDRMVDTDTGRAFVINAAELTDVGWRLRVVISVT